MDGSSKGLSFLKKLALMVFIAMIVVYLVLSVKFIFS